MNRMVSQAFKINKKILNPFGWDKLVAEGERDKLHCMRMGVGVIKL